jgi:hypothetical protein
VALTEDMVELLTAGVAHQVGACTNAGRPALCRGLAADVEADGRLLVIVSTEPGREVLDAIRENGRVALNMTLPENYKSMSLLGRDAEVTAGGGRYRALVEARLAAFTAQLIKHGIPPEYTRAWYTASDEQLVAIRFTPFSARNQSPLPAAVNAQELRR